MRSRAKKHGKNPNECRLLMPVIYIDDHVKNPTRSGSVTGIYVGWANAGKDELQAAHSSRPTKEWEQCLRALVIETNLVGVDPLFF